jgi:tetratricopeptide (TPR) repeat protein
LIAVSWAFRRTSGRLLITTALLLSACATREERFAKHVERGEKLAAEGRLVDAVLEYQSALDLEPRNADLYQRLADLFVRQRSHQQALSFYREAFKLDPERIDALLGEARLLAFDDPKRASELIQLGLERAPDNPNVHQQRAYVALARKDFDEALAAAQRALELDSESGGRWLQLGKVHQGRILKRQLEGTPVPPELYQAALDAFARADAIAKGDARAQSEAARVLAAWPGHREQALAGHRGAIETAKRLSDTDARIFAAKVFDDHARAQRDLALRRESLREVVEADPEDYEAWEDLVILSDGQPVPRGEEVCRELIQRRGDDPRSHRLYVNYLLRERRPADAIAHLQRALDGEAAAAMLWAQLIDLQLRNNQMEEARDSFDEMSDDFPDDPATRAAEARLALADGRIAEGAEILRKLAQSDQSAESLRMLAVAEHRLGDLTAAAAAIERAVALSPGSLELYRLKTSIDYDAKNWGKLLRGYRVLAGRGQRLSTSDDLRRAHALYELGNRDAGRSVLERVLAQPDAPPDAAIEYARREGAARFEIAHAALQAARERTPWDQRLLEALVQLELAAGRPELALARLDSEIEAGRARPRELMLRAQVRASSGDLERAEKDVLRAFEASPTLPGAVELLFEIYQRQGRLAEAQRSFEQAENAGVLHSGARLLLGRLYLSQGELAKAQQAFEKVVAEQPELVSARNDLAFVLAERGEQLDRALELARGVQQALGENPAAIDTLGYVYYRAGQLEPALAELQRAVALAEARPEQQSPVYAYHLGLVLQALGRKDEAAVAFQRALAGDADFPEAEDARRRLESVRAPTPAGANAS